MVFWTGRFIAILLKLQMSFFSQNQQNCYNLYGNTKDHEQPKQNEAERIRKRKTNIVFLKCGMQKNDTDELTCKAEIETQTSRVDIWVPVEEEGWDQLGEWD